MTAKTTNNKHSAKKKLIPAVGMLLASAMALTSSTYAWFTMSREVEVSNIQMTATVPEDIQISLGQIGVIGQSSITASTKESDASLANGKGVLMATSDVVTPPSTNDWDWSNIADISEYYQFGKLIPASSTTGEDIFFTPDANGVGKTIATGARFYMAADNLTGKTQADAGATTNGTTALSATAHVITSKSGGYVNDTWNTATYVTSAGWDNTQDDGYYIDIPVWFRTSSKDGAKLSVQAYVKPKNTDQTAGATNSEALYRAVRVSIIDVGNYDNTTYSTSSGYATSGTTKGLIPVADGWTLKTDSADGTLDESPFTMSAVTDSILNWYGRTVADGSSATTALTATTGAADNAKAAVSALGTTTATATTPTYDKATVYNAIYNATSNTNNHVVELTGPTVTSGSKTSNYGVAHKAVIRVWLEGEDPDCWNETAGQDWSINLKFNNEVTQQTTAYGTADLLDVNKGTAPKQGS